ncbi:MAG: hypothetical protein ACI9KE_001016 [Polyangiales bacterium]|jgi:hypothetical protein
MGALNVGTALLLLGCIWKALPVRWAPVDVLGTLLALLFLASGVMLWRGQKGSRKLGLWSAGIILLSGAILGTALMVTAGTLAGLYGPVGGGGAIILAAACFMMVPYFIVFPASQLYFLLDGPARLSPAGHDAAATPDESEE